MYPKLLTVFAALSCCLVILGGCSPDSNKTSAGDSEQQNASSIQEYATVGTQSDSSKSFLVVNKTDKTIGTVSIQKSTDPLTAAPLPVSKDENGAHSTFAPDEIFRVYYSSTEGADYTMSVNFFTDGTTKTIPLTSDEMKDDHLVQID